MSELFTSTCDSVDSHQAEKTLVVEAIEGKEFILQALLKKMIPVAWVSR